MRIALVHRTFSPTGGTERFGLDLARALLEAGDEVHLIAQTLDPTRTIDPAGATPPAAPPLECTRSSPPAALPIERSGWGGLTSEGFERDGSSFDRHREGLTFHPVPALGPGPSLKLASFLWSSARVVRRLRDQGRLDVVLGLGRTLDQEVLRVGGGCHAAYLEAVEGWQDGRPPTLLPPRLHQRLLLELERRQMSLTRTRHVIAVSHRVREELLSRYPLRPDDVTVVHNGVDLERFNPERFPDARAELRTRFQLPGDALVALFVGNGVARKGYPTLLEAFSRFVVEARRRQVRLPLRLLVVSRDALRRKRELEPFQQRLAPLDAAVVLAGGQREVERFYQASDLLVLPTRYEPFGNVCLEALAMGLPVITTRNNGAAELLEDELGSLCLEDPRAIDPLVEALLGLLDAHRRARLSAAGRAIAARHSLRRNGLRVREVLARFAAP